MFGRAGVEFVATQECAVAITHKKRFVILLDGFGFVVEIDDDVDAAASGDVESKNVLEVCILCDGLVDELSLVAWAKFV